MTFSSFSSSSINLSLYSPTPTLKTPPATVSPVIRWILTTPATGAVKPAPPATQHDALSVRETESTYLVLQLMPHSASAPRTPSITLQTPTIARPVS